MNNINTFFMRVTSRCNLDCDYCYVFKHEDQSWKQYPKKISQENIKLFSSRLNEYLSKSLVEDVLIVFHGGEPFLFGSDALISIVDSLREDLFPKNLSFSIQTNGLLLDKINLEEFSKRKIQISVSIDGPEYYHNMRRKDKKGENSYSRVIQGLHKLKNFTDIFSGVITVINPQMNPKELFDFYIENDFLTTDILLPDANHQRIPNEKKNNPNIYIDWLRDAFTEWFTHYQTITIRSFESILQAVADLPVSTDLFGEGELSYLTIETDGSYHTSDILKTAYPGASSIGLHMKNASILEALSSKAVSNYNLLLKRSSLPEYCQNCDEIHICAGGCLPHRYSKALQYNNPTVYCMEMKALIKIARQLLKSEMCVK